MKRTLSILVFFALLSLSCNRSNDCIIPMDYAKYYEGVTQLTENESRALSQKIMGDLQRNTLGKRIPDIKVKDWNGKRIRLNNLMNERTFLVFSAFDCSYGSDEVMNELPKMLRNLEDEMEDIRIICLVENNPDNRGKVDEYVWRLMTEYSNVFLIDPDDAARINLTASPTKFFVNNEGIVVHLSVGYFVEEQYREQDLRTGIDKIIQKRL